MPPKKQAADEATGDVRKVRQKRKRDDDPVETTKRKASSSVPTKKGSSLKTVLVFAPGAGGSTAKSMRSLHDTLEASGMGIKVWRCDDQPVPSDKSETRWNKSSPSAQGNTQHVVSCAKLAAAEYPSAKIVLCGSSFGCRVIAETLKSRRADLPSRAADALVCCGYPLYGGGDDKDPKKSRAAHLTELPAKVRVCLIQGSNDEFNGPRGIKAIQDLAGKMKTARAEVYEVPGGKHTVPEGTGLKARGLTEEQLATGVCDTVVEFVAGI